MKSIIAALLGALSLSSCSSEKEKIHSSDLNKDGEIFVLFEKLERKALAGVEFNAVISDESNIPKEWSSCKFKRNVFKERGTKDIMLQSKAAKGQLSNEFIKEKVKDFPDVEILEEEKFGDLTVNWSYDDTKCYLYLVEMEGIVELSCTKKT